jgi:hypothetical protein
LHGRYQTAGVGTVQRTDGLDGMFRRKSVMHAQSPVLKA